MLKLTHFLSFLLFITALFTTDNSHAGIGFWRQQNASLFISTTAQSVPVGNCSGVTTVRTKNPSGAYTNVGADLTVNLATSGGLTFYSDISCTVAITSVVVASGTSTASFYFVKSATGAETITLTAVTYAQAVQAETGTTNAFVWTGGGANANWSTAGNWSGGVAPGAGDVALFNGTCSSNCSPTINASISIGGIRLATGFGGTITQGAGNSITVSNVGWVHIAGTFAGGSSAITVNGPINLYGGTFTSTSGTLSANGNWSAGAATFNHNSGALLFSATGYTAVSILANSSHFNNINFNGYINTYNLSGTTLIVDGTVDLSSPAYSNISNGTVQLGGNLNLSGQGAWGSAMFRLTGNASGQTITGIAGAFVPHLDISASANSVTLSGVVQVGGGFTITSVGTFTATGSTLRIISAGGYAPHSIIPGTVHFNNVTFDGYSDAYNLNSGVMAIDGTLTLGGSATYSTLSSGTIDLSGPLNVATNGLYGSAIINLVGNASGQTITGVNGALIPNLNIATSSNDVTFSGTVCVNGNFSVTSVGTLTTTGSTLRIGSLGGVFAHSVSPGSVHYNNVILTGWIDSFNLNNSNFYIDGDLSIGDSLPNSVGSGTLIVKKNVSSIGVGTNGNAQLQFVGSSDQTLTLGAGANFLSGNITVNTTAGAKLVLASAVSWNNVGQTLTVTAGEVLMSGYALTVKALSLNSTTVTKGTGVLTVNGTAVGTGALYGGTVAP